MNSWYTIEIMASERRRDLERMVRHNVLLREARRARQPSFAARWVSRHILPRLRDAHTLEARPRSV